MNKIVALLVLVLGFAGALRAEDTKNLNPSDANIIGHVIDKKTGEHLSFITIFLKGTTIGTRTHRTGRE